MNLRSEEAMEWIEQRKGNRDNGADEALIYKILKNELRKIMLWRAV